MILASNDIIIEQNTQIIALLKQLAASGVQVPAQIAGTEVPQDQQVNIFTVARKKNWNAKEKELAYSLFADLPHIKFLKSIQ